MQGDISESLRQPNAGEESGGGDGGARAPHKTPLSNSVLKRIFSNFF